MSSHTSPRHWRYEVPGLLVPNTTTTVKLSGNESDAYGPEEKPGELTVRVGGMTVSIATGDAEELLGVVSSVTYCDHKIGTKAARLFRERTEDRDTVENHHVIDGMGVMEILRSPNAVDLFEWRATTTSHPELRILDDGHVNLSPTAPILAQRCVAAVILCNEENRDQSY